MDSALSKADDRRREASPRQRPANVAVGPRDACDDLTAVAREGAIMATYIVLLNFTDQGIKAAKDSPARFEAFRAGLEKTDVKVKSVYWTVGAYDIVVTLEGSDEALTTGLLKLGAQGNVRTQTLRGLSLDEMKGLVAKL
jgi:uncharacterized protein with GYD domain